MAGWLGYGCVVISPARTVDLAETLELATRRQEPVIIDRGGNALAAVVPIDLFELWSRAWDVEQSSLIDDLLEISRSVPDEEWAKLPTDGAENIDRYLYGKRP
jgi:hypothetical protein